MEVKIIALKRTPRISKKTGNPFVSLGIKTEQHGDKWLSGFSSSDNESWKEGDTVDVDVEVKGDFLNFKTPTLVKKDSGPAAGNAAAAELKNILMLSVIPKLDKILAWIDGKNGLDPTAIDKSFENLPF